MATIKQDMPPPGGFKPLNYSRVPARTIMGGKTLIAGHFLLTAGSLYLYSLNYAHVQREEVERRSSMLAILPLLQAEQDRAYLKQLRRNRDEEEELMANVPGWEVGTYKGERIFKTYPKDEFFKPTNIDFYAHSSGQNFKDRDDVTRWN